MLPKWIKNAILLPFLLPFILLSSRRSCTEDPRKALKRRNKLLPKSLSQNRKAISLSYTIDSWGTSPFLTKLPLELRQKIYRYALGDHLIHILLTPGRITHIRCTSPTPPDLERTCCPSVLNHVTTQLTLIPPSEITALLLRTCRQIYTEALPLLYSTNAFDFDDLSTFNIFAATMPRPGLAAIKTLHLNWFTTFPPLQSPDTVSLENAPHDDGTYLQFWRTVAQHMPALSELHVGIKDTAWVTRFDVGDPWVRPIKEVRGLKVFELRVVTTEQDPSLWGWRPDQVEGFAEELKGWVCRERE
jgi:hypothetical protein